MTLYTIQLCCPGPSCCSDDGGRTSDAVRCLVDLLTLPPHSRLFYVRSLPAYRHPSNTAHSPAVTLSVPTDAVAAQHCPRQLPGAKPCTPPANRRKRRSARRAAAAAAACFSWCHLQPRAGELGPLRPLRIRHGAAVVHVGAARHGVQLVRHARFVELLSLSLSVRRSS